MVKIKKLTPPQVAAIREAFPLCVDAGVITTTASQVAFHDIPTKEPWRVAHVRKLLVVMADDYPHAPVLPVIRKLDTRPDLVQEVA